MILDNTIKWNLELTMILPELSEILDISCFNLEVAEDKVILDLIVMNSSKFFRLFEWLEDNYFTLKVMNISELFKPAINTANINKEYYLVLEEEKYYTQENENKAKMLCLKLSCKRLYMSDIDNQAKYKKVALIEVQDV